MSCFENFDKIIILVFYIGKNNNNVGYHTAFHTLSLYIDTLVGNPDF